MSVVPVKSLDNYAAVVGDETIQQIRDEAAPFSEKTVAHINSTYQGGGVAEILNSLVILMNDVGIKTDWRVLHGDLDFFTITKKLHNALHGDAIDLTEKEKERYYIKNVNNSIFTHITHDFVVVHDVQPLPIVTCYEKQQPWIWRCHVDLSDPYQKAWDYLKTFIGKYDAMVVSMDQYKGRGMPRGMRSQFVMRPSIDPLNVKNTDMSSSAISCYLSDVGIQQDKPIICQVSRFDKWKDPEGLVKIFRKIRKREACQLVLVGSMATDDPKGQEIFENLEKIVEKNEDIHLLVDASNAAINALQRVADVIVQKSLKEGFALTVSEALWKETPVVGSNVGGIPTQIIDGKNGYLLEPTDYKGFADRIIHLIRNPAIAQKMGKYGKEYVKNNFLLTRHLLDYIRMFKKLS